MPIINLLSVGPGTFVYHLLVLQALAAMAGISLIEWRHTRNPDLRRILWAFLGLVVLRMPLLFGEPLGPAAIAPLINGMEAASLVLLGWAFLAPLLVRRTRRSYLLLGLAGILLFALAFLPMWYRALERFPYLLYVTFWQQSVWHALSVLLALIPTVLLLRHRQSEGHLLPMWGFAILTLGSIVSLVGSLFLSMDVFGVDLSTALDGLGRLINLLGYPFFAIGVYRTALQDMWAYRKELQTVSEESLRQAQELFFLLEADRIMGESLDLEATLPRVVENTTMALDADRCAIFLIDPDEADTIGLATQYVPLQRVRASRAHPTFSLSEQPALDYALQRRKQLILNVEGNNPRLQTLYEALGSDEAGPTIVQPLLRQDRLLGVMVVGNDHTQRVFDQNEGRLCQSVARQVASAIENSRLYHELQAKASQLADLLQAQEDEVRRRAAILESVAEGVIVGDDEGRIVIVNAAAERILAAPRQRILGHSLKRLIGHTVMDRQMDWEAIAQSGAPFETVVELEGKIVHVNAAPVLTPAGDHLGFVAVLRDITKETEGERAKSEFITAISHELRTPLTAIRGYTEALEGGMVGPMSEAQSRFLKIIRDNAMRMGSLTENLIAISELEQLGPRLAYAETDLYLIVGKVVRAFQTELDARQLELNLELEDELPTIEADPARVRQILDNLVSNAVKFTYPGGRITIGAKLIREDEREPAHCSIWVSDTGIGIPTEEQAHIWERFYSPSNPLAAEASGLGVGLSIVKSLAEAHGGRVWMESAAGVGSTFTVLLPIENPKA